MTHSGIYSDPTVNATELVSLLPSTGATSFALYGQSGLSTDKTLLLMALTKFIEDSAKRLAYYEREYGCSAPKQRNIPQLIKSAINFLFTR